MNKHDRRSKETQRTILQAAERCFAQSGYDKSSVAEICRVAGVSKGAFYHHFDSKQAVFLVLLNRWLTEMDRAMQRMGAASADVPSKVMAMSDIVSQLLQVADEELLIYLEFINKAVRDPDLWKEAIEPYHRYRDTFATLIAQGIDEGSLRPIDPEAGATIMIGLAIGLLIQGFLDPQGADWPKVSREGIGMMLTSLKR